MKKTISLLISLLVIVLLCSFVNVPTVEANSNISVDNYEQNYWGDNYDSVNNSILGDDPIVELVDKKYFLQPQSELIINEDYAFFINTTSTSSHINISTVGLIKINISTNLESIDSPSQIVERIEPIFQGDFYTINFNNNDNITINNTVYYNNSGLSTVVMPVEVLVGFKKSDNFYLTNFNFYGNLANVQHLNSIDDDYDPSVDYGSFFTRSDIYFNGYGNLENNTEIGNIIMIALGYIKVPILGVSLGDIQGALDIFVNSVKFCENYNKRVEESYGELYKEILYADANSQISNYGGLIRYIHNSLTSTEENPILFAFNDDNYIENKFTVSNREKWLTSFTTTISFSVVDNYGNFYATSSYTKEYTLNQEEVKSISGLEFEIEGYYLANHRDAFSFTPIYTSEYYINAGTNNVVSIKENNNVVLPNNDNRYLLEKDKKYLIYVSGAEDTSFILFGNIIELKENEAITIDKSLLVKYNSLKYDLYYLNFNSNVSASIYDNNLNIIKSINNQGYSILENDTYYILLSSSDKITLKLTFNNIPNLNLNSITTAAIDDYGKYYSFTSTKSQYYLFTELNNNTLQFYDSSSNTPVNYFLSSSGNFNRYKIFISEGDKIYVGYENAVNQAKFIISNEENYIEWYSNGKIINNNKIVLKQGESVTINAKIVDENITPSLSINSFNTKGINFNPSSGLLEISNYAIPTEIADSPYRLFITFDDEIYYIDIYVIVNISINISPYYPSNYNKEKQGGISINVNLLNPNDYVKVTFDIEFNDGTSTRKAINSNIKSNNTTYFNFSTNELVSPNKTPKIKAKFRLNSLEYTQKDSFNGTRTFIIYNKTYTEVSETKSYFRLSDLTINTLFAGGTGIIGDPFLIQSERNLINIKEHIKEFREGSTSYYYVSGYFKLTSNISVTTNLSDMFDKDKSNNEEYYILVNIARKINIDGDNHTIYLNRKPLFLFENIRNSQIYDLKINGFEIDGYSIGNDGRESIGILAKTISDSSIDNLSILNSFINTNLLTMAYHYVGGICGNSISTNFNNCVVAANIKSAWNIGGLVGYAYSSNFKYCEFKGYIELYSAGDFYKGQENVAVGSIAGLIYSGSIKYSKFTKGGIMAFKKSEVPDYDPLDDGEYIPYIGNMAGLSRYGTVFENNYYNKSAGSNSYGTIDLGGLHSWSAWFQSWNQLANTNLYGDCGKVE